MSRKGNILVLTYWSMDNALIHTYTLPYLKQIQTFLSPKAKIYLLSLNQKGAWQKPATQALVTSLRQQNILVLNFRYYPFGLRMAVYMLYVIPSLLYTIFRHRVQSLHAWCTPGGAIALPLSVLSRRPMVLDSFEPHAESMVEAGEWQRNSLAFRVLFYLEKMQLRRASHIICAAPGMESYCRKAYGFTRSNFLVKAAGVDTTLFDPAKVFALGKDKMGLKKVVCVYAGKFGGIYLEKEIFDFLNAAASYWKNQFSVLLLSSHSREEVLKYCRQSGLDPELVRLHFVPHEEVPAYLSLADFALCPVKALPTKKYCSPIKNGEYWAMGLPVLITPDISVDSALIAIHRAGHVLEDHRPAEYAKALRVLNELIQEPGHRERIRALALSERSFSQAKAHYRTIYATSGDDSGGIK